jgi:hypothetical protein
VEHFCSEDIESKRQEAGRKLIHLASEYGKKMVSPQTGYLHYYGFSASVHMTIPFLDNLHLALLWMRMHTVELVQAGKVLLDNLLKFETEGNFPVFLHEYPLCKDEYLPHKVYLPLAFIYKEFGPVLGQELRLKVQAALDRVHTYCEANVSISKLLHYKMLCAQRLMGKLEKTPVFDGHYLMPEMHAEAALAYYLTESSLKGQKLWDDLEKGWHTTTAAFAGPVRMGSQNKLYPQITAYELLMWYLQGEVPHRTDLLESHSLLWASMLPLCCKDPVPHNAFNPIAITVADKPTALQSNEDYRFHPLYILWGSSAQPTTFTCQIEPQVRVTGNHSNGRTELLFTFEEEFSGNDDDKAKEVNFYFTRLPDQHPIMTVNGIKASIFEEKDLFTIEYKDLNIKMHFEVLDDQGRFVAHLLPGNRPSQLVNFGGERFSVFDWQILLRTVTRNVDTKLKVIIEVN